MKNGLFRVLFVLILIVTGSTDLSGGEEWSTWRGPHGDGTWDTPHFPKQ